MDKMWEDIVAFHNKFQLPAHDTPSLELADGLLDFRVKFMQEELEEFVEALTLNDSVKAFDALIDLVYVAMGTAYLCQFPWQEGWTVVQAANMTKRKVDHASESKRGSIYDIVKPEGWVSPELELSAILTLHARRLKRSQLVVKEVLR